jgi:hypothetical protein
MGERKEYKLVLTVNKKKISRVIIDNHYKENHPEVNNEIILSLVKTLDGKIFPIEERKNGFEYFVAEPTYHKEKPYRLVLLLYRHDDFLGVINAFRVRREK